MGVQSEILLSLKKKLKIDLVSYVKVSLSFVAVKIEIRVSLDTPKYLRDSHNSLGIKILFSVIFFKRKVCFRKK